MVHHTQNALASMGSFMDIVCISPGQSIRFVGQALVEVQEGHVNIFGYKIGENYIRVISPRIFPLLTLKNEESCVARLKLTNFDNGLGDFEFMKGVKYMGDFRQGETFRIDPGYDEYPNTLLAPDTWRDSMIKIGKSNITPPVICVCGNKKVGKSSFSRYATNSLLNTYQQIVFFDLDCGQTEFTPPGFLSCKIVEAPLIGPPSSHIVQTEFCEFVGLSSVEEDPLLYFNCAAKLAQKLEETRKRLRTLPVVINTMGWTTGLGFHILQNLLILLRPTHIISVQISIESGVPCYLEDCFDEAEIKMTDAVPVVRPIIIPVSSFNVSEKHMSVEPSMLRDIITRVYFHCEDIFSDNAIFNFRSRLSELLPHRVNLDSANMCCIGSNSSEFTFSMINLAIVAVSIKRSNCSDLEHFVGLIRGICSRKKILLLLAPISKLFLESSQITITFRPGFCLSKRILMEEEAIHGKVLPYLVGDNAIIRSSHISRPRKVRSNIQRKYTSAL